MSGLDFQHNSTSELESLPGMTRRCIGAADTTHRNKNVTHITPMFQRKVVLLATASITDGNIFNNGLYQNCFLIYRLAEALGYMPIFVIHEKPTDLSKIPEILHTCRIATLEDIVNRPLPVVVYIEIGMSISSQLRKFMKMLGARTTKLYLGNILNIDVETPMFFPGMNFSHHVTGEQDEIWTSPHYGQNAEYAAALNKLEPKYPSLRIAPYVWDPCIMTDDGRRHTAWRPHRASAGEKPTIIIMEPNISFQKTGLIPILIAEEYARKNPDADFDVIVFNSDRLCLSGHYKNVIEPCLTLAANNRIKYTGRHEVTNIMKMYPYAVPICHHFNNEFNYMVLEFLYAGYPVLHNCRAWDEFGYFYDDNNTIKGSEELNEIFKYHHERLEIYKTHARNLAWRHCIYNPDVQKEWEKLIEGK